MKCKNVSGGCGFFGFLGFIGALVYFWQSVNSFQTAIIAFFKACVWPAFLIYKVLASYGL